MKEKRRSRSVAPIYALGITVLFYSLLFSLDGLGDYLKCAFLAWAVYMLVGIIAGGKKEQAEPEPETPPQPKEEPPVQDKQPAANPELEAVIAQGRQSVARLQSLNDEIPDFRLSAKLKQIEALTAAIYQQVANKPEKLPSVRQFMNYYLPTTIKLLEQYVQMQNVGLKGENITAGMAQIEAMLDKVIVAFQKQLDGLFAREVVDITADIRVMEQMMEQNGLTGRSDFKPKKEETV